jgi:tricorn protease-like protein
LPAETPAPGPDAPAQLWAGSLLAAQPKLLAGDVDLLVPALWSPDGSRIVFRRSGPRAAKGSSQLFSVSAGGGAEQLLVSAPEALFPIGFAPGGDLLYYAALGEGGSYLHSVDVASGTVAPVTSLSAGLTRDWALSTDGRLLAFLEMTLAGGHVAARAVVLDLAAGTLTAAGSPDSDAFNPRWDAGGNLYLGQLRPGATKGDVIIIGPGLSRTIRGPLRGFDVPLAVEARAGLAVTSFDGRSVVDPGRAMLVVVGVDGSRREISSREVTFLGWITP